MRLALLAGFCFRGHARRDAADYPAHAHSSQPCRLEHPARMLALPAECGTFSVPENPAQPDGRKIELFVARVPAISLNKAPDPLFLIAGGPGTSAVDLYTSSPAPFDRVRRDRDIILLDQRGTGRSHRLDCEYGDQDLFQRVDEVEVGRREHQVPRRAGEELGSAPVHHQHRGAGSRRRAPRAGVPAASICSATPTALAWRSTMRAVTRNRRAR